MSDPVTRPERWLPVAGWEGLYEVSDRGRVRGVDRLVNSKAGSRQVHPGRVLSPSKVRGGYWRVRLCLNKRHVYRPVHHLVLEAFDKPRPEGTETLHGPGGPGDNRWPENIRWGTSAENTADTVRDGTYRPPPKWRGVECHTAKLTDAIVRACRLRRAQGEKMTALAIEFGVSVTAMSNAIRGKTWQHV